MSKIFTPDRIYLKNHPEIDESVIQKKIADNPSILGLGELILKDKERQQPRAGRLDLLLQAPDSIQRYEVEIQLGKTDESHIIRTIEYWDIERKRYAQYDHCAVIIAEDITSRFLNVISLLNGHIPLIAIQLQAYKFGDEIALIFNKVLDQMQLGLVDEDEEVSEITDRKYWLSHGSDSTVKMADEILELINQNSIIKGYELKYNKFYIGLAKNGRPSNFVIFRPKKNNLNVEFKLPQADETNKLLEENDLDVMEYSNRWGTYRIRLSSKEIKSKENALVKLILLSEQLYTKL